VEALERMDPRPPMPVGLDWKRLRRRLSKG
jgi:hypothetical protein